MALQTPTTAEIGENIIAQLEATLNQTIPLLPKAFNRVLAKALAGVFILLYKYGGFTWLQIFVSTASSIATTVNGKVLTPLIEWGRLIGVGDPVAATQAELITDITVTVQTGSLPSGTQLLNADNGVTYITIGVVLLNAATVQATIRAVNDQQDTDGAGVIGNLDPGAIVTFANPLANVVRDTVIDSQTVTGADAEDVDIVYRQRVIDRFQKRPQGGALADYELWGEEVAGILNVYPYTGLLPGQVDLFSEATDEPNGIPTTPQLEAVLESVTLNENGLASRRPANAFVNSFPISRRSFDIEVTGLTVDNEAQVQADIISGLTTFFTNREPFIDGLTIPPRTDLISRSALIGLVQDIVAAANGTFTTVFFEVTGGSPIESFTLGRGEKAKRNAVDFNP